MLFTSNVHGIQKKLIGNLFTCSVINAKLFKAFWNKLLITESKMTVDKNIIKVGLIHGLIGQFRVSELIDLGTVAILNSCFS